MQCIIDGQMGGSGGGTVTVTHTDRMQSLIKNGSLRAGNYYYWEPLSVVKYIITPYAEGLGMKGMNTETSGTYPLMQVFGSSSATTGNGHTLYCQASVFGRSSNTSFPSVYLRYFMDGSTSASYVDLFAVDGKTGTALNDNNWHVMSGTLTYSTSNTYMSEAIAFGLDTCTADDTISIRDIFVVDLTEYYGAGNEPTKAWCDANLLYNDVQGGTIEEITYSDDVTIVSPLNITADGIYTGNNGYAYNPISVNIADAPQKDVNYIDYDGRIVYSYTANEFAALSSHPTNPVHAGLISEGWNWTLEDAKASVAKYKRLWIGQSYITDDGDTRIYIHLDSGRLSPCLCVGVDGSVTVNWGDGSAATTLTGSDYTTLVQTNPHTYPSAGNYIISLKVTGTVRLSEDAENEQYLLCMGDTGATRAGNASLVYMGAIQKIEMGSGMTLSMYALRHCHNLTSITLPTSMSFVTAAGIFNDCCGLHGIVLPSGLSWLTSDMFAGCTSLNRMSVPKSIGIVAATVFEGCHSLTGIEIPTATMFASGTFTDCTSLVRFTIADTASSLGASVFSGCYGLGEIHFTRTTPPTIQNSSALADLPTDCKIFVPAGCLSAYTSATNYPSASVYTYVEE